MIRHNGFGAELTLLELIIVIGLFAVFAAMDLRIFAVANRLEKESDRLSHAVIAAESAAECFKAGEEPVLYFDSSWLPTDKRSAEYIVTVDSSERSGIETARFSVTDKNEEIFTLTAKAFSEAPP